MQTAVYELCEGIPAEFVEFMNYSRSLRFDETPSYTYLKNLFENLRFRMRFENDFLYDWDVLNSSNEERTGNNAAKKRNNNNNNN